MAGPVLGSENLKLWEKLGKTDPKHTKPFQRGGGFKGTAIKPIYTEQKMTEEFGPCGVGWGFTEPTFQVVPGDSREILVYCWLSLWYVHHGKKSEPVPGVGGDKIVSYIKANPQYNRPERWESDDEAFKKAFTDAVGNAMKHIGMSADVHMGLFDDSKYRRYMEEEFREEAAEPPKPRQRDARGQESRPPEPDYDPNFTPFDDFPAEIPAKTKEPVASTVAIKMGRDLKGCASLNDLKAFQRTPEFRAFAAKATAADMAHVNRIGDARWEEIEASRSILDAG